MRPVPRRVVYLHGFNSSPESAKACQFRQWCAGHADLEVMVPALSWDPSVAVQQLQMLLTTNDPVDLLVGSSLGGYYATWFVENAPAGNNMQAALVNPAVAPCRHLGREFLGHHVNPYTGDEYVILEEHVRALGDIEVAAIADPAKYLVLLQTGDEVLDYRLAVDFYRGSRLVVQDGGSHSFENFTQMIPQILEFAVTGPN
jgi:predicted esterase YcpF (UPF0227 family)